MRWASSSFAVTVDMKGGEGFCQVALASAGFRRSAARATSGLWKAPLTRSLTVLRAPRGRRFLDQPVDRRVLARDHDLAGAVVVRRPDSVDREAQVLDDGVVEPEHCRHRPGSLLRRLGHRLASLADERDCVAGADRVGGRQGRVLAHRVSDHVVGLDPERASPRAGRRSRWRRALAAAARFASAPRAILRSRASPRRSRPPPTPRRTQRAPRGTPPRTPAPCPRPASPGPGSRMRSS